MNDLSASVVHAFVRAINRQNVNDLVELMTDDHRFVDSLGGITEGRERMRAGWIGYFKMVPDYTVEIKETFSNGPVVAMLGTAQGTFTHDGQLKPENRWSTPTAFRAFVQDGKIAEWHVYCDNEPIRQCIARKS